MNALAPALLHVADAAYPFPFALLPADVHTVAGYAGGDTPHAWSTAEIHAVRLSGREWWAIWTAPNGAGVTLTGATGQHNAAGMVAALHALNYPPTHPVFLDIERGVYDADPAGAAACASAWRQGMHAAGWRSAHVYCARPVGDWWPNWTGARPASLPPGVIGEQYASSTQLGRPFDLSVFDAGIAAAPAPAPTAPAIAVPALIATDTSGVLWVIDAGLRGRVRVPSGRGDRAALIGSRVYARVTLSDELLHSIPIR